MAAADLPQTERNNWSYSMYPICNIDETGVEGQRELNDAIPSDLARRKRTIKKPI